MRLGGDPMNSVSKEEAVLKGRRDRPFVLGGR
jgi:hypothetical protein